MLTKIIVIISEYIHISSPYAVHLKLIQHYISIKLERINQLIQKLNLLLEAIVFLIPLFLEPKIDEMKRW